MIRRRLQRKGAETAEAAVTLPLVVLVIFAGFEYGWLVLRSMQLDHVARIGARYAVLSGSSNQGVQERVQTALTQAGISGAIITVTPTEPSDATPGEAVVVQVEVPYASVRLLGLSSIMPLPSALEGRASMVKEPDA
jgi:Flp pilus assembly protein TadG